MENGASRTEVLFSNGEYGKILKLIDSNGGLESVIDNPEEVEKYVLSCFRSKKPRKLSNSLKFLSNDDASAELFVSLLGEALEEDRKKEINSISRISKTNPLIDLKIRSEIFREIIREKYRPRDFSTSEMAKMIEDILNDEEFYVLDSSSSILEVLRLRVQKLFRSGNFERIRTWFKSLNPRDENFGSYKFYLLSFRSMGEADRGSELAKEAVTKIRESENFDSVLDYLYTVGDNAGIVESVEKFGKDRVSFKSNFIIARTLRRMGDIGGADKIMEDSKRVLIESISTGEYDQDNIISNIKQIGFSGDIETSERLLYKLLSDERAAGDIVSNGNIAEIIDLVRDTLDRQKRIRLNDSLVVSRLLIKSKRFEESLRLLSPYISHGIRDSAELFELYAISANGAGKRILVSELIDECAELMASATVDRLANTLESSLMYSEHRKLCDLVSIEAIDSFKFLRSYFNVVEKDSGAIKPKEMLIRLSKKTKPKSESVVYFIERYSRLSDPIDIFPLVRTLRIDRLTRIYCSIRIGRFGTMPIHLEEIKSEILDLDIGESGKKSFTRMIEEFVNFSHAYGDDIGVVDVLNYFSLDQKYDSKLTFALMRSLISLGSYNEVEEILNRHKQEISEIERWRVLIEIGNIELARTEMEYFQRNKRNLKDSELSSLKSIFFKLAMFSEYLEITTDKILDGRFSLSDLTRHYFALFKLGEDALCMEHHQFLKRHYCHFAEKRAIIATAEYDFGIPGNYLKELNIAVMMDPNRVKIPLLIAKSFLSLERPDIAFHFLRKALKIGQRDRGVLETGRLIQKLMIELEIEPRDVNEIQIINNPIFTDVEVLRKIMKTIGRRDELAASKKRKKKIAVHSHTLDIGGAERQASFLLSLLYSGKVRNQDFSLVTHRIPNKSNLMKTYYKDLEIEKIKIEEYIKPGSKERVQQDILSIVDHLNPLKARRLTRMIEIYSEEEYDLAHTWQDYCNIYGGVAALISGVPRVLMSARTLPPPQKGQLASRQGRSYRECYQILLNSEQVLLTHNSDFGNEKYVEWLEVPEEKNITIHNGLDISKWTKETEDEFDLRKELGIRSDGMIVGYVGRFTSDKRPWLFLKIAENILLNKHGGESSESLLEWYMELEEKNSDEMEEAQDWGEMREIDFVMLGDGPQYEKAKEIIEDSNVLRNRVHLVGFSPMVGEYLRNFDCFLLTSKVEGLPNVVIEAQTCGVPVVSTNAGGSKECLLEGETGMIAYDDSPKEVSRLLFEVLSNDSFSKMAKKNGLRFIERKFGLKTYSKRINKLYSEVFK